MRSTALIFMFPLLLVIINGCGGGDNVQEGEFHLADVPASDLSPKGMAKDFTGDTNGLAMPDERVFSPDSSKVAWCDGQTLYVADADGTTRQALHTETEDSSVFACFRPMWGADGKTLSFKEARRNEGDSVIQVVTVDITLGESEEE